MRNEGPTILVSADMEGATGITSPDDVLPGSAGWERMRRVLTADVNAIVESLVGEARPGSSSTRLTRRCRTC